MFVPIQPKKMYEHVIDQIYNQILEGDLKKGDKLPPERELTDQLSLSRTSVREALRALEVLGVIQSQQGEGNFISGDIGESLIRPLASIFTLNGGTKKDAIELRLNMEVLSATLAAERINQEELGQLKEILDHMKTGPDDEVMFQLDDQFHEIIAKATGNYLIVSLIKLFDYITDTIVYAEKGILPKTPELSWKIYMAHFNIFVALKKHNPEEAAYAMETHIRHVFDFAINSSKSFIEPIYPND